jgi:long-chain acyl-CoA synthetase
MTEPLWQKSYPPGVSWQFGFEPKPVYALFDEAVKRWPKRPLCDFLDKRLTYHDVEDLVDRATKGFQALGVKPGVHVGLYLPNTPHYIVCFFAILKAGGTVVNYSPLDAERELQHKIEDSHTDIVVTLDLNVLYPKMAGLLGRTRLQTLIVGSVADFLPFPKSLLFPIARKADIAQVPKDGRHLRFRDLIGNDGRYARVAIGDPSEALAVIQYTGGTTGTPKGAMLTHANLVAATEQIRAFGAVEPRLLEEGRERTLTVLPLFHIYALTVILLYGAATGTELILHPRFDLEAVIRDLARKKPTVFPGVPTMYAAIAGHPRAGELDLTSLKLCNSGGAPLPPEVASRFEGLTGSQLLEGWGMTETCAPGTGSPLHGRRRPGSCGVPMPGVLLEFVDVDDPLKVLPYGERGEICVTGPNVMMGYWQKPGETDAAFAGGRFHTGDIGTMDEDGFVYIVDRKKDMILSGGFNVYPRTVEDAIYEHPAVEEVTVIGVPDDYRGQAAKAFVKLRQGADRFSLEELRAFLADKLGRHELPAALEFRPELPKTPVGKLSKKELIQEEAAKRAAAAAV